MHHPSPPRRHHDDYDRHDRRDDLDRRREDHRARMQKCVRVEVPIFDGSRDSKYFIDWESSMNSYFHWYRMNIDLCVEYVEIRLGEQPKIFWENEHLVAEQRGLPITTWAEMDQKLRNKYVPRQYKATFFLSWLDLQQGKSIVQDFIHTFEEHWMRC